MLQIEVGVDGYDETTERFVATDTQIVELEHSLLSLSKWEAKWELPFLSTTDKTTEQTLSYIKMMFLRGNPTDELLNRFSAQNFNDINMYINAKMTATTINDRKNVPSREIVTAEVIYHWMFTLGIPLEFENRHLNHLLTLIKVCNIKNSPKEKMSRAQAGEEARRLNAERKAAIGTRG